MGLKKHEQINNLNPRIIYLDGSQRIPMAGGPTSNKKSSGGPNVVPYTAISAQHKELKKRKEEGYHTSSVKYFL